MGDDFETLLDESLADPEGAHFPTLRAAYAESRRYLPFGRDQDAVEDLHRKMAAEDWEQALDLVEALLTDDPLSISLRFAYAHILEHLDDEMEASAQRTFGNGLLRAVLGSGDGRSPESAMLVLDTREMYLVVEVMGLRAERTQLAQVGAEWIERVEVKGGAGPRALYFNVSLPQSWLVRVERTEEVEIGDDRQGEE